MGNPGGSDPRTRIRKLGTVDCDMVETTPVVFAERLYRFEYVRDRYYEPNAGGESYFRFVDMHSGEYTPPFARGFHLGSAYVDGDTVWAYGVPRWGGPTVEVFSSSDLIRWRQRTGLCTEGWGLYNTSVCRGPARYVMAVEVGEPPEEVGVRFTIRFAESDDLESWRMTPPERVYSREKYTACPALRYVEGMYYMIYLEALPGPRYASHVVRSADLVEWQESPYNPLLSASEEDKAIANPAISETQRRRIEGIVDINNSDVDLCEYRGRTVITYSWGTQRGDEFLALAEFDGPPAELLRRMFP